MAYALLACLVENNKQNNRDSALLFSAKMKNLSNWSVMQKSMEGIMKYLHKKDNKDRTVPDIFKNQEVSDHQKVNKLTTLYHLHINGQTPKRGKDKKII